MILVQSVVWCALLNNLLMLLSIENFNKYSDKLYDFGFVAIQYFSISFFIYFSAGVNWFPFDFMSPTFGGT